MEDQEILDEIFKELNLENEIIYFGDGDKVLDYLITVTTEPFIILSDIHMPKINGIELREKIYKNEDLRIKCIPYLFFTTNSEQKHVVEAYSKSVQGFFIKQ